jgi:hypothetical protein
MSGEKASPKKKAAAKKTPAEILRKEITEVCRLLDEESLVFLKRQADVLLHNSRVEKLRQDAREHAASSALPPQEEERDLTPPPRPPLPAPDRGVKIEQTTATTFNVYVGKKRVFFNRDEMRALTRICHAAANFQEGGKRLFAWFRRERMDFLIDTDIGSSSSPVLAELCGLIVHTYKVKE